MSENVKQSKELQKKPKKLILHILDMHELIKNLLIQSDT